MSKKPSQVGLPESTSRGSKRSSTHKKRQKHHHHHRRHKESALSGYERCIGLVHVILSEEVQALLKCVVGESVTAEKPWTYVNKFYIQEQVESEDVPEDFQTFLPHKQAVIDYPNDEMMIGYIPDESRDYDEFYFCLTQQAEEVVNEINHEREIVQKARLENTINKKVGVWKSLGSDNVIEEGWMVSQRGYYKIEFEARYPIIYSDVKFRFRKAEAVRDGYVELKTLSKYLMPILHKKRIDNGTQVAQRVIDNIAQTFCSYPLNAWTQYEYLCPFIEHLSKEFMELFRGFTNTRMDSIYDTLHINGEINFYSSDYTELCNQEIPMAIEGTYREYQTLDDVKRCKGKMISAFCWHPMWTGVVAIAYADISPRWYYMQKHDSNLMEEVVHGFNPILLWCFNDTLNPKLILETNSEVHCLSFCPHDPNVLVGGCANGQIIVWDIKNKISKVETEEILTPAQQTYRTRLFNDMSWMKNTRDYSIVPPTAYSNLNYSHMNNVTAIDWIHPLYSMYRTGRIGPLTEENDTGDTSLQFVTSSSDGTLKFWDLKQKAVITGEYKLQKKSRRLSKRPSALTVDVSPYRILNRRMLPHVELQVNIANADTFCPVSCVEFPNEKLVYEEKNPDPLRVPNITDRIVYEPIYEWPKKDVLPLVSLGTYTGDFILASWEGYDYTSGDVLSKEELKFNNFGKYHDGPVLTCCKHPLLEDVYMSIGGKIFCIWLEKLKGKPVLWRRSRSKYTHGGWDFEKPSGFRFTTSDGSREFWNVDSKSDGPYSSQTISGKPLLEARMHPFYRGTQIVGIADDRGTLRLMQNTATILEYNLTSFELFLENNANRIMSFEEWQTNWTSKHASWIKEQQEAEKAIQARLKAEQLEKQAVEEEMRAREAFEAAKHEAAKQHAPPGKYEEWARERWILKEQERMGNELLSNKRLDKETLMKQQLPIKRLDMEAARKQQKIKQRLLKVDEIFTETIAMLFPNLVERASEELFKKLSYTEEQLQDMHQGFLSAYEDMIDDTLVHIEKNPFSYVQDWKMILEMTKVKKFKESFRMMEKHSDRHRKFKIKREAGDSSNDGSIVDRGNTGQKSDAEELGEEESDGEFKF